MNDNEKTCQVCGSIIIFDAASHYVARDDARVGIAALSGGNEPQIYDAIECPKCGCQIILGRRKRTLILEDTVAHNENKCATNENKNDVAETKTSNDIKVNLDDLKGIIAEIVQKAVRDAMIDKQVESIGNNRKGWIDVGRVFKSASNHDRKVSMGYIGTMCESARLYCEKYGVSVKAFEDRWCDYLDNPESTVDSAYAMARLRTRKKKAK